MLCITRTRKPERDSVTLVMPDGSEVVIRVVGLGAGSVRLGFIAPRAVEIWRSEVLGKAEGGAK